MHFQRLAKLPLSYHFTVASLLADDACSANFRPADIVVDGFGASITSPNFPGYYPNNADCQWRITSSSSGQVR